MHPVLEQKVRKCRHKWAAKRNKSHSGNSLFVVHRPQKRSSR